MIDQDILDSQPEHIREQFKVAMIGLVTSGVIQLQMERNASRLVLDLRTHVEDDELFNRLKHIRNQNAGLISILDYGETIFKETD